MLKEMRNKMNVEIAECAKCGVEIEFATSEEFEKLVNEHIHTYPLG
jgi:Zn ribbon nucleic-acid-binding protein